MDPSPPKQPAKPILGPGDLSRWLTPVAMDRRAAACAAQRVVRLGALVNGSAAAGAAARHAAVGALLDHPRLLAVTSDLAALDEALYGLLVGEGANVLAVAGGDGTLHFVVGALLTVHAAQLAGGHEPSPFPRLLLLGGGTLNIVARTVGIRGGPTSTVARFVRYFRGAPLSRVPARALSSLKVQSECGELRHGFVFGSEALHHAIELYVRFGAGYRGLGHFLLELGRGATIGSALWRQESWRLGPFGLPLDVDGIRYDPYTAVVATMTDLTLAIGGVRAIRRPLGAPGFHAKIVTAAKPSEIVSMVPSLMRERPHRGVVDHPEATQMTLFGPYTLDGECFGDAARGDGQRRRVEVHLGPSLPAVPAELGMMRW